MASDFLDRLEAIANKLGVVPRAPPPIPNGPPDLARCLSLLRDAITHHQPALRDITYEMLTEYAVRRLIRDHYINNPKGLAGDIQRYQRGYTAWQTSKIR